MSQQCVYFHTEKTLKETEEILKQQGMEIILKTDSLRLNFSDMTEEEQLSYLKTLVADLEHTCDRLELQEKELEIVARQGISFSKEFREICNKIKNSRATDTIKRFQHLQEEYLKIRRLVITVPDLRNTRSELVFNERVRCSCLIAKMGTDVIRYLAFENDPIITINGPKANELKSTLEQSF